MLKKIRDKVLRSKKNSRGRGEELPVSTPKEETPSDKLKMLKEYEQVKSNPLQITGEDFDRAFAFLEKYPQSIQAAYLIEEMFSTSSYTLKGLSYESAVNILTKMPDHPGAESIIRGMYKIDKPYINKLISDVLVFMLEVCPDHPHAVEITQAIVRKNFTNGYGFINRNPYHPQTKLMIKEMFKEDPNIAILLLQEKMDHPQVASIIQGIYNVGLQDISKLTPNAVIFVLEVAPDHEYAEELIGRLVEENYIKAYEFIKEHMEYPNAEMMVNAICRRKPELKDLF